VAISDQIRRSGMLASGGGISHFTSLMVAEFAATGEYARNVDNLRTLYAKRRDALLKALFRHLDGRATWLEPKGGYFVWLSLTPECSAETLLSIAVANGMSYMPGSRFFLSPERGANSLRLAFSRYPADEIAEAVRRLAHALDQLVDGRA
ncbi:MAG: aminotransferase class I/II-fold pyridoxal phosphate-dependent enzyme, partial [Solirubrobacteraceae bacterium]